MTSVGIHQPNFLPWLGLFYKIYLSDIFILHDNVEFSKRELTKRTLVRKAKNSTETTYLIVPLCKHSDFAFIKDLQVHAETAWYQQHFRFLRTVYGKAPFLDQTIDLLTPCYEKTLKNPSFADFTINLIRVCADHLQLKARMIRSSELPVTGVKSAYNIALVKHVGGTTYLSGQGAAKYQDEKDFTAQGIALQYLSPAHSLEKLGYPQYQGPFVNGLSIVDALVNIGSVGIRELFHRLSEPRINACSNN